MKPQFHWLFRSLVLGILLLAGMGVQAQVGKISGRLLLDQNPIADEMIVLKNAEGRICNGTMTDELGEFTFPQVPAGTYLVSGKYKDFEAEVECVVTNGEVVPVSLHCKKKTLFQWVPNAQPIHAPQPVFTLRQINTVRHTA